MTVQCWEKYMIFVCMRMSTVRERAIFLYLKVFAKEQEAEALYYDMKLPLEAAKQMRPEEEKKKKASGAFKSGR